MLDKFRTGNRDTVMADSMWIDIVLAISCAACGGMCGWISHAMGGPIQSGKVSDDLEPQATREDKRRSRELAIASNESLAIVAETLHAHAKSMSNHVDVHQQKVTSINHQLRDSDDTTPEIIAEMVNQIIQANEAMQVQLQLSQDQLHHQALALASAEQKAKTDALTRIPNRGAFDEHLESRFKIGPETTPELPHAGVMALLDVDHFKKFNDVYGHQAGDEVLRVVAGLLHHRLHDQGIVARYGGEEFAVVIDSQTVDAAAPIIEQVRQEVGQRIFEFEGKKLSVSVSMGLAALRAGDTIKTWIERADEGLYKSKAAGRDCGHIMASDGAIRVSIDGNMAEPVESPVESTVHSTNKATLTPPTTDDSQPSPLSYLPDREAVENGFDDIRSRSSEIELSLIMLRCSSSTPLQRLKSLLPIVRSNLRNVDKLGYYDDQTLMVLLPSVNQSAAELRGAEMISAAESLGLTGETSVRMGVANVEPGETFAELLECVVAQIS